MGGGERYPYPQWVWSPIGGWWAEHKQWKRNTGLAILGMFVIAIPIIRYSLANEQRVNGMEGTPSGKLAKLLRVKTKPPL